jgi:hypothetical protein
MKTRSGWLLGVAMLGGLAAVAPAVAVATVDGPAKPSTVANMAPTSTDGDGVRQSSRLPVRWGTAAAAAARPAVDADTVAAARLTVRATELAYGQPDANGNRVGSTQVTVTNVRDVAVEYPMVTFFRNGRDDADHASWSGCPYGLGRPDRVVCIAEPLAAGERRTLTFPFHTDLDGPPGRATVRVDAAADVDGTPIPGTGAQATYRVSFASPPATVVRLSLRATDLIYGEPAADGIRRGRTRVTVVNTGGAVIDFPMITFFRNGRDDAEHADWSGCPVTLGRPDRIVCVAAPLAVGDRRTLTFPFLTQADGPAGSAMVRVDAGVDRDGTVLPGTGEQTTLRVWFSRPPAADNRLSVAATDMVYTPADGALRRGSTVVTIVNNGDATAQHPTVTFPVNDRDVAAHAEWECPLIHNRGDRVLCVLAPLAVGERRSVRFRFVTETDGPARDAVVRVDAAADTEGTVLPETGLETRFSVSFAS